MAAIGSRSGVTKLLEMHPTVAVYVGAIDESLTPDGLITPGIGDAGVYTSYIHTYTTRNIYLLCIHTQHIILLPVMTICISE